MAVALSALALLAPAAGAQDAGGVEVGETVLWSSPAVLGSALQFNGTLGADAAGRLVEIQVLSQDGSWQRVTTVRATAGGAFLALWRSPQVGQFTARATLSDGASAAQTAAPPTALATVYRAATATWYDQSGRKGACGVRLRKRTLGVAHKTLPCGSLVDVTYRGRTITVPVVDRGPYSRGVSYDLTIAAAKALGVVGVGRARVGVLPQAERTPKNPLTPAPLIGEAGGITAQ